MVKKWRLKQLGARKKPTRKITKKMAKPEIRQSKIKEKPMKKIIKLGKRKSRAEITKDTTV